MATSQASGKMTAITTVVMLVLVQFAVADPVIHCPRDDHLSDCVAKAFMEIINAMLKGDKEHHIPKMNPVLVPEMPINKNAGKVLNLNLTLTNLIIKDMARDVTYKSAKFDYDKMELTLGMTRPVVEYKGGYKVNGKILWLPIWGDGTMTSKMTNVDEIFVIKGEKKKGEDGKLYWHLTDSHSMMEPKHMVMNFENLFNGNWILGKGANTLINNQWKLIYRELHPIFDAHYSNIMRPHWADIIKRIPLDEAFPDPK